MKTHIFSVMFFLCLAVGCIACGPEVNCDFVGDRTAIVDPPTGPSVSFNAFGDWGWGGRNQKEVARAMEKYCLSEKCEFIVALGDNFYPKGVTGIEDEKWQTRYLDIYGDLDLPFYPLLGNHDLKGNFQAQIDYSDVDPFWRMADKYYSVRQPTDAETPIVEIFFFAPWPFDENVKSWLRNSIDASKARWKLLAMHVPIISNGSLGDDASGINGELLPLICGKIDLVISGHDHIFSHLSEAVNGCRIEQLIIGTGGAELATPNKDDPRAKACGQLYGFGWFEASEERILFRMVQTNGEVFYGTLWKK